MSDAQRFHDHIIGATAPWRRLPSIGRLLIAAPAMRGRLAAARAEIKAARVG